MRRGVFVPEFDKVLFDELKDGEITPKPVKTQFGYHIIQRLESREVTDENGQKVEEVHARHILIKTLNKADFINNNDVWVNTKLSGRYLKRAQVTFDRNTGSPQVAITFNEEGKKLLLKLLKEI